VPLPNPPTALKTMKECIKNRIAYLLKRHFFVDTHWLLPSTQLEQTGLNEWEKLELLATLEEEFGIEFEEVELPHLLNLDALINCISHKFGQNLRLLA
jgi:acyl carrier protein